MVALAKCSGYQAADLGATVGRLLEAIGCRPGAGARVLVKPNLLAPTPPDYLPCTHPGVVRAICRYLLDLGAQVRVGDSPTFGKGVEIAGKIGLTEALADLPVPIINLGRPKLVRLSFGGWAPISREALENDLIVNVPRLKAHHQMRITAAVKNMYGCITGLYKPLLHLSYGDRGGRFRRMLYGIWDTLPPSFSLLDAVTAMHVHGPNNGQPYSLGLLAASESPVALDSAVMSILGIEPRDAPMWQIALKLGLPGAKLEEITYPLEPPELFDGTGFQCPADLFPISFRPLRVCFHWVKRWRAHKRDQVGL